MATMQVIRDAIDAGEAAEEFPRIELPETMRAACVRREDAERFAREAGADADPRETVKVLDIPLPPLGPGEALVAVMASSLNYNTVWTSTFRPVSTFAQLDFYARTDPFAARHATDYHAFGSDAAGVVLRTGPGPCQYKPGDEVVISPSWSLGARPSATDDFMTSQKVLAWGYETNFGGFAEVALVQSQQLMPKPPHLSWEEAACMPTASGTAYRMLVGERGARMKQGDVVLIWGAASGIGGYALQYVLNGGGIPVCVVSSPDKEELLRRYVSRTWSQATAQRLAVLNRADEDYSFVHEDGAVDEKSLRRFRKRVEEVAGEAPDIVFEHPGRATFPASVYVVKRGGTVVTCGSSSGYMHSFDNRHLWLGIKKIVGSHIATHFEMDRANQLAHRGMIHPTISQSVSLDGIADAAASMLSNQHVGKIAVLCLADREGKGIQDAATRERLLPSLTQWRVAS